MQRSSLYEFFEKYPDEKAAVRFFEESRWLKGVCCPRCDSKNIARVKNDKPMPLRCRTGLLQLFQRPHGDRHGEKQDPPASMASGNLPAPHV